MVSMDKPKRLSIDLIALQIIKWLSKIGLMCCGNQQPPILLKKTYKICIDKKMIVIIQAFFY
ncbi:hypothetical protein D3C87_1708280 [compost metagenome]